MAMVAARALPSASGDDVAFYRGKLQAARYWFGWELPKTEPAAALLQRMDGVPYEMEEGWF